MIPFDEAKKILNKRGHNYTDDEIKSIREFVDILISIDHDYSKRLFDDEAKKRAISGLNPPKRHPNRLKQVLKRKKISVKELSQKTIFSETIIQGWCDNTNQPDLETLIKIAKELSVEVRELLVKPS